MIELTLSGIVTGNELRESTSRCIAMQKELDIKSFIVHADNSEIFASRFDLHDIVENQYYEEGLDRDSRIAIVLPSSITAREAAIFYEAVSRNRGWNVQTLPDRQTALAWLTETVLP